MRTLFTLLLLILIHLQAPSPVFAQSDSLILTGNIQFSIKSGDMEASLKLQNIPHVHDYFLLLNSGLNLHSIKNMEGYLFFYDKKYIDTISYESFCYYIPSSSDDTKYIPDSLEFNYVGKFPVIADTENAQRFDWKGNIAFNGYSVRADGEQCNWYPVFYDIKNNKKYDRVKCDLSITCEDCDIIYLNSNKPVTGGNAHFVNNIPFELLLYAGNFPVSAIDSTYFLNTDFSDSQMKKFSRFVDSVKQFYENRLNISYKFPVTFIQTTPTANNSWLFASYPAIVNVGAGEYSIKKFFREDYQDWGKSYVAHELAHYYFGNFKRFNGPLGDLITEGFSEYLASKATQEFVNDSVY